MTMKRKVRKKAHIRNRYNQIPHLTNDTIWESEKTQENITHKRAKKTAFFPTGDHKATRNRQDSMAELQKRIHKRSTALERSVKNTGGLKHVWFA